MKTLFTLGLMLAVCANSFAVSTYHIFQTNWRWRNNDGGETTATWKAAQDSAVGAYNGRDVIRLRIEIVNKSTTTYNCNFGNSCPATISLFDSLQYTTSPADNASWRTIGIDISNPFVIAGSGNYVTQNEATTPQLTDSGIFFSVGKIMVTDSVLVNNMFGNSRSEYEWSLAGTSHVLPGTTYYFRQKYRAVAPTSVYTYSTFPALTTNSVLPVTLSRFTVSGEGDQIKIEWSSASEQNTSYFNVQRSTNAQTWQTISQVKAFGASASANQYMVYDNRALLSGTVYYRLAVVDKDGKTSYSSIVPFTLSNTGLSAFLYPNPANDVATLQFAGTAGAKYSITITDLTGKPVLRKEGTAAQGNNKVILNVRNLADGVYFVRLVNGGSVQNLKLVKGK